MFLTLNLTAAATDSTSPPDAELDVLSISSSRGDKYGNFVMDPVAAEMIQRHARQQCGHVGKKFKFPGVIN